MFRDDKNLNKVVRNLTHPGLLVEGACQFFHKGIPKNQWENILQCEYTCKACGKRVSGDEKQFFSMAFWQ